jgi:hypothetical protein
MPQVRLRHLHWFLVLGPRVLAFAGQHDGKEDLCTIAPLLSQSRMRHQQKSDPHATASSNLTSAIPAASSTTSTMPDATEGTGASSLSRMPKVRAESSVDGFQDSTTSSINRNFKEPLSTSAIPQDIGSLIQSFLINTDATSAMAMPTVHNEKSANGWQTDVEQDPSTPQTSRYNKPHWEVTEDGLSQPTATQISGVVRPVTTGSWYDAPPQNTPPPPLTQAGFTLQPVIVTSTKDTTAQDGQATTSEILDYQYVVDSKTLAINSPITVNNVVLALSTDTSGSTILVADGTTTTLPAPIPTQQQDVPTAPQIATTVVQGTTMYVLAGQTLAPGQPVTVDGITMSINTSGGSTVLAVGTVTTTLVASPNTRSSADFGPSTAAPLGTIPGNGDTVPTTTSTTAGANKLNGLDISLRVIVALAALYMS